MMMMTLITIKIKLFTAPLQRNHASVGKCKYITQLHTLNYMTNKNVSIQYVALLCFSQNFQENDEAAQTHRVILLVAAADDDDNDDDDA